MANRTAAFGALLAWHGKSPIQRTSFLKTISVFVRWNKLLLSKGTVVLCSSYNATLHFKLTAFHLPKMGVTHITVAYLLQSSLTTDQNRVHLTRSNYFNLVWHSRKISNNIPAVKSSRPFSDHILWGETGHILVSLHWFKRAESDHNLCLCTSMCVKFLLRKVFKDTPQTFVLTNLWECEVWQLPQLIRNNAVPQELKK